jgi:hypothetical protein
MLELAVRNSSFVCQECLPVGNAGFVCQKCFLCQSGMFDDLSDASFFYQEHFMTSLLGTLPLSDRNASFVCQERFICLSGTLPLSVSNALFVCQ